MTEHYIHAAAIGTTVLPGITGQTIERQRDRYRPESPGNRWNRLDSVKRQIGLISLTTPGIKTLLDLMPQGTLPVPCMKLADPLVLWAVENEDDLPMLKATAVHEKLTVAKGLLALRRLSWREPGEPMIASATCWPLSDNGVNPYWTMVQAAAPADPPVDADWTLDSVSIGGDVIGDISDLELEIDVPWTPRFRYPKSIYPDYIASSGSRGICNVRIGWRSLDRKLLRSYGDGFMGTTQQTVELILKPYAQLANRGATAFKLDLKCAIESSSVDDGRPSTVQVNCTSLSLDGSNPFRWGYA